MALDLSGFSELPVEENTNGLCHYVLLSSDVISSPDSKDILFYITDVGHLILANFLIENVNGVFYLRKHTQSKTTCEFQTPLATNVPPVVDKCARSSNGQQPEICIVDPELPVDATLPRECESSVAIELQGDQTTVVDIARQPSSATVTRSGEEEKEGSCSLHKGAHSKQLQIVSKLLKQIVVQLLASGNGKKDVIVEGHNLSELQRFVRRLRTFRQSLGLSQKQLSSQLVGHFRNKHIFSQALLSKYTICNRWAKEFNPDKKLSDFINLCEQWQRYKDAVYQFEKLNVSIRSAYRLLPYLELWMNHVTLNQCKTESKLSSAVCPSISVRAVGSARSQTLARLGYLDSVQTSNGQNKQLPVVNSKVTSTACSTAHSSSEQASDSQDQSMCTLTDPKTVRQRRKRTFYSTKTLQILTEAYNRNPRPRGNDLSELSKLIEHDRESIRMWFCNRRQLDAKMTDEKT